jgi:hypothetical protein
MDLSLFGQSQVNRNGRLHTILLGASTFATSVRFRTQRILPIGSLDEFGKDRCLTEWRNAALH